MTLMEYLTPGEYKDRIIDFHQKNIDALRIFPASRNQHHCYSGGYYEHVQEVANNVQTILPLCVLDETANFTVDDVFVAAYFHDIDKACSTTFGESYRYVWDTEPPTDKQLSYARSLNIEMNPRGESKTSLSYKIGCMQDGKPIDPFNVPHFISRSNILPMDDGAIVASICAHNGITLNDQVLSAICCHHGGWSPLIKSNGNINPSPLGVLIHTADFISSHLQNGKSLGR